MITAGVASVDVTPPAGLAMAGFGARTDPAKGTHDPLTVRALVVGDTALAVADVIGIDAALSARVRARCGLRPENVTITAVHNHGGPASMEGRLSLPTEPEVLARLEEGLVTAITRAAESRQPVRLNGGTGAEPGVARNRRHPDGPVDTGVPVLRFDRADGSPLAVLLSYACHPVVLGADNLLWTADYPHFVRQAVETALPGAVAIFATGCPGDVNTGHSAADSLRPGPNPARSFAEAERIGKAIAAAALEAPLNPLSDTVSAAEARTELHFERRETAPLELAAAWEREAADADPVRAHLLRIWADWARALPPEPLPPLPARVSALDWGGARLLAMPGEIFARTALDLRGTQTAAPLFVLGYADDNPGYIPAATEYAFGGYEVEEAHRFYGLPAGFAPGSAEALARAVARAAEELTFDQSRRNGEYQDALH
ncbi:neutral/alkaline non-lysosomal ceramidase N-terminal domain-containing protein [Frigidibacter sp. ROC022]|uniref:neutral/alkaline non-lysosomal ceramidase N-terminal domain-containing protein n=1 Tax=Frigidibacter sp. ROC022 TaxID=2971796 RepID=UPI00215AE318|nr:neutral/alkaline non-lysosomal ceramidase N-terminal domain-containing protein [Frigidibacter sp. ROC022]MCR8724573.1 neutral/alkaline non-lysosomal ceramidase N-terminal domain-containing protein [Frigidibacter sp. ROC022]